MEDMWPHCRHFQVCTHLAPVDLLSNCCIWFSDFHNWSIDVKVIWGWSDVERSHKPSRLRSIMNREWCCNWTHPTLPVVCCVQISNSPLCSRRSSIWLCNSINRIDKFVCQKFTCSYVTAVSIRRRKLNFLHTWPWPITISIDCDRAMYGAIGQISNSSSDRSTIWLCNSIDDINKFVYRKNYVQWGNRTFNQETQIELPSFHEIWHSAATASHRFCS